MAYDNEDYHTLFSLQNRGFRGGRMTDRDLLLGEIHAARDELIDKEWTLYQTLGYAEDIDGREAVEMYHERARLNLLADKEILRKLEAAEWTENAHTRLDYLLGIAGMVIDIYQRRLALGRLELWLQRTPPEPEHNEGSE
jgi:hypothetical protein